MPRTVKELNEDLRTRIEKDLSEAILQTELKNAQDFSHYFKKLALPAKNPTFSEDQKCLSEFIDCVIRTIQILESKKDKPKWPGALSHCCCQILCVLGEKGVILPELSEPLWGALSNNDMGKPNQRGHRKQQTKKIDRLLKQAFQDSSPVPSLPIFEWNIRKWELVITATGEWEKGRNLQTSVRAPAIRFLRCYANQQLQEVKDQEANLTDSTQDSAPLEQKEKTGSQAAISGQSSLFASPLPPVQEEQEKQEEQEDEQESEQQEEEQKQKRKDRFRCTLQ